MINEINGFIIYIPITPQQRAILKLSAFEDESLKERRNTCHLVDMGFELKNGV
jgi:hypothetical protein